MADARFTFGESRALVRVSGAEFLTPMVQQASASAAAAATSASTATSAATSAASSVSTISLYRGNELLKPNLLTPDEVRFNDLSRVVVTSGTGAKVIVDGAPAYKITGNAGATSSFRMTLPISAFEDAGPGGIGVQIYSVAAATGTGGNIRVQLQQLTAASSVISAVTQTTTVASGVGALAADPTRPLTTLGVASFDATAAHVRLYVDVGNAGGSATPREWIVRLPVIVKDDSVQFRESALPAAQTATGGGTVWVSTAGDDTTGTGTKFAPLRTFNAALDAIGGRGLIRVAFGSYGPEMRITPSKVTGRVKIIGERSGAARPILRMEAKLTGTTLHSGKVYKATVAGITLSALNWLWQDGVNDARTLIAAADRDPEHNGRTHRLPSTKIVKVTDTSSLANAVAEMQAASDPRCYYEAGVAYFTIDGGGDATAADIYVSAARGLIDDDPTVDTNLMAFGCLGIEGVEVRYGGINLRPFVSSEVTDVFALGARGNCIDYAGAFRAYRPECAGGGDQGTATGDGLSGHDDAQATIIDPYLHDCQDDGESNHENGRVRTRGGLVEYNGGAGACPAYGCDAIYDGVKSRRNQRVDGRKPGAFASVGAPLDGGADTRARFVNCIDIESAVSFYADTAQSCFAEAVNCKSVNPTTSGYVGIVMRDCTHSGTGTAKGTGCTVANTALVA